MSNILKLFLLSLIVLVLVGCVDRNQIANMILKSKELNSDAANFYNNNKDEIDKIVNEILVNITQKNIAKVNLSDDEKVIYIHNQKRLNQIVIEESERLNKESKMAYRRIKGGLGIFDTSGVYEKFGFHSGDRVLTKWGEATVIGILEGDDKLWFHIDGKKGASFWSEINERDFKLIKPAERNAEQKRIKMDSADKEDKTSLESRAIDTIKDVYLLGEIIPPIQPIIN